MVALSNGGGLHTDTISAVRLEFIRNRGLRPSSLQHRVRRRLSRPTVSQARLKLFLGQVNSRPRVRLPAEAPRSVALVVPCYGHMAYLPDMLASIVAQTRPPDEVVFVDDCSPDGTRDLLGAFIATQQGASGTQMVLIVNDRNLGQSASLNRGISAASSELIMILNDDDYLMHDAIETTLALFGRYKGVALIGANHVGFAGHELLASASKMSGDYVPFGRPLTMSRPEQVLDYRLADDLSMTHSGLCFFKAAWEAVGGYQVDKQQRVTSSSDRDFQIRVNALWPVVAALDIPLAFWRNDSSVDGDLLS